MWWPDVENKSGTNHRKNNVSFFFAQCFLQSEFTVSRFLRRKRMEHGIRVCGVAYLRRHIWLLDARGKYVMVGCCFGCVSRFLAISAIYSAIASYSPRNVRAFPSLDFNSFSARLMKWWKKKLALPSSPFVTMNTIQLTIENRLFFILYKWKIYV